MISRLLPTLVLALGFSFLGSTTAAASAAEAEERLRSGIHEFLSVAQRSKDTPTLARNIRPVLENYVSFDAMTRRAIGPGWRQFSPQDRSRAVELFTTLVIRTYVDRLNPGEQPEIRFRRASTPAPGRVDIPTTLRYQGSNYDVTYRMEKMDIWRITDVLIEGVSFVANYRSQFDPIFQRGGAAGVMQSLNQSVAREQ